MITRMWWRVDDVFHLLVYTVSRSILFVHVRIVTWTHLCVLCFMVYLSIFLLSGSFILGTATYCYLSWSQMDSTFWAPLSTTLQSGQVMDLKSITFILYSQTCTALQILQKVLPHRICFKSVSWRNALMVLYLPYQDSSVHCRSLATMITLGQKHITFEFLFFRLCH